MATTATTTTKTAKAKKSKQNNRLIPRAQSNTFREGVYSVIYDCLYHYRRAGISRDKLISVVREQLKLRGNSKADKLILYSISVVVSARKDKLSHRSARKHSDFYYVEATGFHYKLHLKD